MISNLPSSLITEILSCLPTKDVVATSVLSTKWKKSWMSVTNLDFDDKLPRYNFNLERDTPAFRKFTAFVTRVLLLREKSCLQRVRIKCYRDYDDSLVNAWLTAILQCNVQELDISIYIKHQSLLLPSDIFLCCTLMVRKLKVKGHVNMPISAYLPRLRTLHLAQVELSSDVSITSLLYGCPLLEELSLCRCLGDSVHVVKIIAPVLKSLIIKYLSCDQIVIDTPALEYFDFHDCLFEVYAANMDHLREAKIHLYCSIEYLDDVDKFHEMYYEAVKDIFIRISHVEKLSLSCDSMQVISWYNLVLPKFRKLTYLKLKLSGETQLEFLGQLLDNAPYLQSLYILQGWEHGDNGDIDITWNDVPSCFLFHLKEVEIDHFFSGFGTLNLEYILKNAKVLEKLTLHHIPIEDEDYTEFFNALASWPRASTVCEILVLDWTAHCQDCPCCAC